MEQKYLQDLIDTSKKELRNYNLYAQDFGLINTLFIKKALDKDNYHLFIQLAETKKLYLPIIKAIFIFLYEKNYCDNITKEFNVGDIIFNKNDNRSYKIEAININLPAGSDTGYKLTRKRTVYGLHGINNFITEDIDYIPNNQFNSENYIKVTRDTTKREDFKQLINFLKEHLKIEDVISSFTYKIAIVCCKKELINDLRIGVTQKTIPYHYLTRDGKPDENLPIEPLIYIASDYQTIREHVFDKGEKLEAVIFFDKYNGAEIISKDIRQGQLKRAIFIGEDDLEFKHEKLLTWHWTTEEFCYFYSQDFSPAKITPIYVENPQLLSAINIFITDIEQIEKEYTVQFSALKQYAKRALLTVVPESNFLSIKEFLFNDLYSAGWDKDDIDDYADIFQDNYQDIIKQVESSSNAKLQRLFSLNNFDYLIVSKKHKENWQQLFKDKTVLTYSEWKRNKDRNKKVLFLGLYGYSHYQAIRNSFDTISILIYANSQEQQAFEYYEEKYLFELGNEYHSKDRKTLSCLSYPQVDRVSKPEFNKFDLIDIEQNDDVDSNNKSYQREEILLKYSFEDSSSEILPTNRHILIKENESLMSEILANVKIGDIVGVYHNFNKDKLEDIATPQQKQAILECKKYAELWKNALVNFYKSKLYYNKENLLKDLQNKGADISHINTLNKWLDMNDKTLFPSTAKNIMAIKELVNDDKVNENIDL